MTENALSQFHSYCKGGDLSAIALTLTPALLLAQDSRVPHKQVGLTALAHTVMCGQLEAARALLTAGAAPDAADHSGDTPLHYAAENSELNTAQLLLTFNADVNVKNGAGETPLFQATFRTDSAMMELLLEHGALPNMSSVPAGRAPLHVAVLEGSLKCALLLISYAADLRIRDSSGLTPLDLATPELDVAITAQVKPQKKQLSVIEELYTEEDSKSPPAKTED